MYVDFYGK
jgi:hypothetical protein